MLEIRNVDKYFNKGKKNEIHVIDHTTLTLPDQGLVALLGPSGCGKTTLLNAIGGLDKVKSGQIYIDGQKVTSRSSHKVDKIRNIHVGYIFQDYKLLDDQSVYDNVAIVLKMIGIKDKEEINARVEYVLDKVGMLRYRYRLAGMLSGGERQRVGIARAIAKDPDIILADEPTGNLDSKNSVEIMNIIKAISKEHLVILVTHEQSLARFYASRIIEIRDGKVVSDEDNKHQNTLDYQIDNRFYLQDFASHKEISDENNQIDIYRNQNEKLHLSIVLRNGNIYIQSNTEDKIQIVDDNSSIEFIDDHYKGLDQEAVDKYNFDFTSIINKNTRKKYSAILNPITMIINGFKNVFDFPILKKILFIGFFLSGIFMMYAVSTMMATTVVDDADFITIDRHYVTIGKNNLTIDDIETYEQLESVDYILPGDSTIEFTMVHNDYYQTMNYEEFVTASIISLDYLDESSIIAGRMPEATNEIVIDTLTLENWLYNSSSFQMVGYDEVEDFLGQEISSNGLPAFTIVGISDTSNPSAYVDESLLYEIMYYSNALTSYDQGYARSDNSDLWSNYSGYLNYSLVEDYVNLKQGSLPVNDYEMIVPYSQREDYPINKDTNIQINGHALKVVGYYESNYDITGFLVNDHMIKVFIFQEAQTYVAATNNSEEAAALLREAGLDANDSYEESRTSYIQSVRESNSTVILMGSIILVISLVEIYLMIRSSFLSRIKEIGIYRAIGVKKFDIYKMFAGEIIAITTVSSLIGIIFMAYILYELAGMDYLSSYFLINPLIIALAILFTYLFNLLVGLLPVFNTIRKTPAEILSRYDLD